MFNMTQNTMPNDSQNTLPAPYELNTPQIQSYSRGGSTSRQKGLEAAHVNRNELSIMDHLQGGAKIGKDGVRSYAALEALLKNPHILHSVHKNAHQKRKHHASGGYSPSMERLAEGGRNGDTELALIGPHTHHLFNQLAGHATRNPNTGHPEYFDISGALGGLWNTVKGAGSGLWDTAKGAAQNFMGAAPEAMRNVAQAAAPALTGMAQQYMSDKGGDLGRMAGQFLPQMAERALGPTPQNMNPMYQNMGESLGRAAQGYAGGLSPSQAAGQGFQNFGGQMGGGLGRAIQQGGQYLGQGGGWGGAMRQGAQRGFNEMGGAQGIRDSARNIGMGALQGGLGGNGFQGAMQGGRNAMRDEMSQYGQRMMPRAANQQQRYPQQQYNPYEQEEDPYDIYG